MCRQDLEVLSWGTRGVGKKDQLIIGVSVSRTSACSAVIFAART